MTGHAAASVTYVVQFRVDEDSPWHDLRVSDVPERHATFNHALTYAQHLAATRDRHNPDSTVRYRVASLTVTPFVHVGRPPMPPCPGCNPPRRCPLGGPVDCSHCAEQPARTCTINRVDPCGCTVEHAAPGTVTSTSCAEHPAEPSSTPRSGSRDTDTPETAP